MSAASSSGLPASTTGSPSSTSRTVQNPAVSHVPSPEELTPGLEEKFPDLLPPRAFYLAEVMTPEMTPADLVALKELVETDFGATLRLKRAWVPFSGCQSGVLPLDVHEELTATEVLPTGSLPASSSLRSEALDSVEAVHRESSFRPKRSRRIQNLPATGDLKSSASLLLLDVLSNRRSLGRAVQATFPSGMFQRTGSICVDATTMMEVEKAMDVQPLCFLMWLPALASDFRSFSYQLLV